MDNSEITLNLMQSLRSVSGNQPVLNYALEDFLGKLYEPRHIRDLLSSKMTVRQVTWALGWLLERTIIEPIDEDVMTGYQFNGDVKSDFSSPYSVGHHLIDSGSVRVNPLYRSIAKALLKDKKSEFGQSIETMDSQIRRFKFMKALGYSSNDSILVLGDDALFSLFLATHGVKSPILVADIDADLLDFIRVTAKQHSLTNIDILEYSVFEELPERYRGAFDSFAVNGFKDLGGLLTFICRGLQSLKSPTAYRTGYFNFGSLDINDEKIFQMEFEIQKFLTKIGVSIEHIVPCPESYISPNFERQLADLIRNISLEKSVDQKILCCDAGFEGIKREFRSTSWVGVDRFPDIHLSPLKIAQIRVNNLNGIEVSKFLRLSKIFTESTG